jgi:hypothetical protein
MNLKKESRKIGSKIHRTTGISFPLSMQAGKKIARFQFNQLIQDPRFKDSIQFKRECMDPDCSCNDKTYLVGNKGSWLIGN